MKFTKDEIRSAMLLYAVTDRAWLGARTLPEVAEEVLQNGATFLQVREKGMDHAAFLAEAGELKALAGRYHVPFVVNDSVEVALECGADGVHVGQSDIQGRDIRALIGPDKILGISANTVETALSAQKAGADYIGVGAVFGTTTKKGHRRGKPSPAQGQRRGRRGGGLRHLRPTRPGRGRQAPAGPGGGTGSLPWISASVFSTWTVPWWTPCPSGAPWARTT